MIASMLVDPCQWMMENESSLKRAVNEALEAKKEVEASNILEMKKNDTLISTLRNQIKNLHTSATNSSQKIKQLESTKDGADALLNFSKVWNTLLFSLNFMILTIIN